MALRCAFHHPVTSSPTSVSAGVSKLSVQHAVRAFSSYGSLSYHSPLRRDMQTSSTYRPHTLPESGVPPQNSSSSVADTAISADFLSPSETKARQESGQITQERDSEVQSPSPAGATAAVPHSQTRPKHRRPLRPRKAAMKLTPVAVEQLRKLLSQPEPKLIRVGVKNRGCSGLAYHLEYVDKPGKFDEVVEQDGVKVLIDSKALFSIIGSEMDWQEDRLSRKFVFRNPNISEFFLSLNLNILGGMMLTDVLQRNNVDAVNRLWFNGGVVLLAPVHIMAFLWGDLI